MANHANCSPQSPDVEVRPASVAGTFYPAEADSLLAEVARAYGPSPAEGSTGVRAVIVPHAGYVYSASTAAETFARIAPATRYRRIFLIGPSHRASFNGASVEGHYGAYATPLGPIAVDTATCNALLRTDSVFTFLPKAHAGEHCLEVQLPLLQCRLDTMPPIVPIIIGAHDLGVLERIADALRPYFTPDNLFVISSDFAHYPSYDDARSVDAATGDAIATASLNAFLSVLADNAEANVPGLVTSACGQAPIAVLLMLVEGADGLTIEHIAYRNSGDTAYGDRRRVVGYHAFAVVDDGQSQAFGLSAAEQQTLLSIAGEAIRSRLEGRTAAPIDSSRLTETLRRRCGAFVTLNRNGRLRGCIGNLVGTRPLHVTVEAMARAAAFDDPRFPPLTLGELPDTRIEISVLSPLRRIESPSEIQLGRHGILIVSGQRSGTFLPKVAIEQGWTTEEMLGHCARDKAGIGWDGWRTAELYTYEAEVFGD